MKQVTGDIFSNCRIEDTMLLLMEETFFFQPVKNGVSIYDNI